MGTNNNLWPNIFIWFLTGLMVGTLLLGCTPVAPVRTPVAPGMLRWVDTTNGVTCYIYSARGISCLPAQ